MIESQRRAYLEALDITVWLRKSAVDELPQTDSQRLAMEPGSGSFLLLCRDAGEKAAAVAADISRYLGNDAVWGWPDPDQNESNPSLADAVDQRLFTRVIVFGAKLAERLFDGDVPPIMRSAQIIVSADLDELALAGACRKELWQMLRDARSAGE